MPRFLDEATARQLYNRPQPQTHDGSGGITNPIPPATYGQGWAGRIPALFTNRASGISNLGAATNASILIVGSGFGHLIAALRNVGIDDVYGIEPGAWFWSPANAALWAPDALLRTANDWIGSGTEQATLTALAGVSSQARFNWIIDEDAACMHSDTELPAFITGLEARLQGNARSRIVHLVSTLDPTRGPGDSMVNWKTLTDWEAVAPDHTWIAI